MKQHFLFLLLIFSHLCGTSQAVIVPEFGEGVLEIGTLVEIFEDTTATATLAEIRSGKYDSQFKKSPISLLNFSFTKSAIWLRFELINPSKEDLLLDIGSNFIHSAQLYQVYSDGEQRIEAVGRVVPFSEREIKSNRSLFSITRPNQRKSSKNYLKVHSQGPIFLSPTLTTSAFLLKNQLTDLMIQGMYYGFLFIVVLISLFMFVNTQKRFYLYFGLYALGYGAYNFLAKGFVPVFMPEYIATLWENYFSLSLVALEWVQFLFISSFLQTRKLIPKLHLGMYIPPIIATISCVIILAGFETEGLQISQLVSVFRLYYLVIFIVLVRKSAASAASVKWIMAGQIMLILSYMITILAFNDNVFNPDFWIQYGVQSGNVLELIFLAIALTLQFREESNLKKASLEKQNQIEMMFGQQVSKKIVTQLLKQKDGPSGRALDVTVMFLDIRNFTVFAESHLPSEVADFQNAVFRPLIDIIDNNNGIIHKFLGDGFMASFGAPVEDPEHPQNAVKAAIQAIEKVRELSNSGQIQATEIGIGLHSGRVVAGNIGNEIRNEYTLSGMTVNIAARLEALNKEFNTHIIFSDEVKSRISTDGIKLKNLGEKHLKGRKQPIEIFTIETGQG